MSGPVFDPQGFSIDPAGRRFAVLNDSPVGEGGNEDLLEATATARNLADLILASRDTAPFTLAIDAGWGMGKSSLLRQLARVLEADPAVSTVWFNAWTSERASAVEGLIKSVLLSFDRNVIRRSVRGVLRRTHVVGALRAAALVTSSFLGLRQVVDAVWEALAVDAKSRNEIRDVVRSMAEAWLAKGGSAAGRRLLVVFIDDLDRCSDERIVEVCEAIKLYLDVPGLVFVLACDQAVLWQAVGRSTGNETVTAGLRYLEKIIQINYPIPPASSVLTQRLVDGYVVRSGTAHLFDDAMKKLLIERTGRNPRRIKRVINSFVLEHHLNRAWDELGADNLVKIILLQHFYPQFYGMLLSFETADPVRHFLDYHAFRQLVKQGGERDVATWRRLFTESGLKPPDEDASLPELGARMAELEQELPLIFPELATDKEFVSLVHSLPSSSSQWRRLLRKPLLADGLGQPGITLPQGEPGALTGMRVLWIDDHPDGNSALADQIVYGGAQLERVSDMRAAVAALARLQPNVLISDVRRGRDQQAGFDGLEYLREHDLYDGPVYFYVGQVTPARLARTLELGADGLTSDPAELLTWLRQLAGDTPPVRQDQQEADYRPLRRRNRFVPNQTNGS
ncbi:P-loop NTPase fold protein [Amycolatopsis cynarae]|uniref:P-loop NTPase fold protein n=1 Tax=Amycolatopsis cynarae TaxID=2995223 RepID=A0ABY7B810_9PSEU|nr:P-loop NTPase fold protein [Amycolatopsis sp. HUAS 11-8]WAL67387.1 P-loop NTPase fold protein [Amycolatopsis sp. HUAS 11-8]